MKLYILTYNDSVAYPSDDEMIECLVRAENETKARQLANENHKGEGAIWHDPEKASCERITVTGDPDILMIAEAYC